MSPPRVNQEFLDDKLGDGIKNGTNYYLLITVISNVIPFYYWLSCCTKGKIKPKGTNDKN